MNTCDNRCSHHKVAHRVRHLSVMETNEVFTLEMVPLRVAFRGRGRRWKFRRRIGTVTGPVHIDEKELVNLGEECHNLFCGTRKS